MFPISDDNPRRGGLPYVNIALITLNVLVFLYELGLRGADQDLFFFKFGLIPGALIQHPFENVALVIGSQEVTGPLPAWATLFTSMFIHGGILHIVGNMVFLWVFGDNVEDRFGHVNYLIFYVAMGLGAALSQVFIDVNSTIPTVGASGAIAGVLGAYLVLFPFRQIRTVIIFFFITVFRIPAIIVLGFWILLQFFSGITSISGVTTTGVAYWAHIGGFVAGALTTMLLNLWVWGQRAFPRRSDPNGYWRGRRF